MELALVLIFFLLILLLDFRIVLKCNNPKEIYFYAAVLALSFPILVLRTLGVKLPDPSLFILEAVRSFFSL